ncbi:aminotransferase, class V [Candidatus Magnetoovum chiemensis]|nr:aminotransferase, class V [Candidatus Magnetoovum chiemensis]
MQLYRLLAFVSECVNFNYDEIISSARQKASEILGGNESGIFFSKSTTAGIQIFILGYPWQKDDEVLLPECEFPANRLSWLGLGQRGVKVRLIKTPQYKITLKDIENNCNSKTKVITISWVQYISGQRVSLEKLGGFCKSNNIMLVVDAIQGLGAYAMNAQECGVSWVSADGHKWLCGPEGIGIVWASEEAMNVVQPPCKGWFGVVKPFDFEALDQDFANNASKYNDGSPNILGIMALSSACAMLLSSGIDRISQRITALSNYAISKIKSYNWHILTPLNEEERAGIITFKPQDKDSYNIFSILKQNSIICSVRAGYLRISPHAFNTESDLDNFFTVLERI